MSICELLCYCHALFRACCRLSFRVVSENVDIAGWQALAVVKLAVSDLPCNNMFVFVFNFILTVVLQERIVKTRCVHHLIIVLLLHLCDGVE